MRKSICSVGVCRNGRNQILLRWSPRWNSWNLIGGHVVCGEDPRDTLARELIAELGLPIAKAAKIGDIVTKLNYTAFSVSAAEETEYDVTVFDLHLADPDNLPQFTGHVANGFATEEEILNGCFANGEAISEMTRRALEGRVNT